LCYLYVMMPLSEIFFLVIVFYLLYRFVFNFLVPVLRTTRHVRQQFRNMRNDMGQQASAEQTASHTQERHSSTRGPAEDYIDFEEIKK
jgi:Plant ATP synthase F0